MGEAKQETQRKGAEEKEHNDVERGVNRATVGGG